MAIAPLDIILLALTALAAIRCALRGFVAEVMSVAAVIGGIVAAIFLARPLAGYIGQHYGVSPWNPVIAFLAVFLCCYLIVKVVERTVYRIIDSISLDKLDRALGFFLGIAEGILVAVVIVLILKVQPFFNADGVLGPSRVAHIILKLVPVQPILHGGASV